MTAEVPKEVAGFNSGLGVGESDEDMEPLLSITNVSTQGVISIKFSNQFGIAKMIEDIDATVFDIKVKSEDPDR